MGRHVVEYFCKAYKKEIKIGNQVIRISLINTIPQVLGEVENNSILGRITEEEVKRVVFSMKVYKAPGPDGFPPAFFQKFWEVVKNELIWATKDLFRTGKMLKRINKTFIALVPKTPTPRNLLDFRPISLCNTVYKVFAKVMVNRIKPFLENIMGTPQKGFVLGRQILDASKTTHEIIHSTKKNKKTWYGLETGYL